MPTHGPDLSRLSINQLSQVTGFTRATVSKRLEGLDPDETDGRSKRYVTKDALARLYRGDSLDLTEARARLAKEQADKQEMDNAIRRGDLVAGSEVEEFVIGLLSMVKTQLLAVPAKAAPEAHGAESIAEVEEVIRVLQFEALGALADAGVAWGKSGARAGSGDRTGDAEAPAASLDT